MTLRDLTPDEVGRLAHEAVLDHAASLAMAVGHAVVEEGGGAALSDVRHALRDLTRYAQTGEPPEGRPELIHEYLISVAPLYTTAGNAAGYTVPELDEEADPATPWGLVVVGTVARELLSRGRPVRAQHLATLAGVSTDVVYRLIREGELRVVGERRDYRVPAKDARRWLAARGVAGFR